MSQTAIDLIFVVCILVEAAIILACMVYKITLIGYVLPVLVAIFCTGLTVCSIRDFFKRK